ncbi:MAG: efflux RND transporter periplasmic adaptor subunit [Vicinamibacterales bacterium]
MKLHKPTFAATVIASVIAITPGTVAAQNIELAKVVAQKMDRTIPLPGEFFAYQRVSVFARVPSFVQEVHVDRGSVVKRGQPLVTLTAPELAAQVAETEARAQAVILQLAEADAKLVSARTTAEMLKMASNTPGAVSISEMILAEQAFQASQSVRNAVENSARAARASADAVKELAGYLQVAAPFDGVITERFVHPGALVGPATAGVSMPLVQIEQNTRLRLVVAVPEAHVAAIVRGATVAFTVPAHPGESFKATIARPAQALDARTRSMMVELDVSNPGGRLATGMFADVTWPVRRASTSLLVPATSVVTTTERTFVIRNRAGRAEWVSVRRGAAMGELVEVFGELREGDLVVRRGNDEIREGAALGAT